MTAPAHRPPVWIRCGDVGDERSDVIGPHGATGRTQFEREAGILSFRTMLGRTCRRTFVALFALVAAATVLAQEPSPVVKGAQLTILQINDVYETTPIDGRGGLARVATLKQNVARAGGTPFLVLAGDFLSSSVASSIFRGKQMIETFNAMGLDLATLGNHEFDFGKQVLLQRMAESKFQYVIANVLDEATNTPVGGAAAYLVKSFGGLKVGFFGVCLAGEEISGEKRNGLRFLDPFDAAGQAIESLHREGVQAIIAITHMSYDEDRRLAQRHPDISVIVGGHEHFPITSFVNGTLISKAGSDAKYVARIDVRADSGGVERHLALMPIDGTIGDEPKTAAVVADYEAKLGSELDLVVGTSRVAFDGDSRRIRTSETNLGDLVADAMRAHTDADIAIINSGSIRGDRVIGPGALSRRTLLTIHPFGNIVCKLSVPGSVVASALEFGTALWPAAAGRFPQVSGVTFALDANRPAGNRVVGIRVGGESIAVARMYTLAVPDYLVNGGDGYTMFAGQRVLVGPESGDAVAVALEQYLANKRDIGPQPGGRIRIH